VRRQAVAAGEVGVRALRAPVGGLDGREQRLLEPIAARFVEQLVGVAQRAERDPDVVGGGGERFEELLPGLGGDVRQARKASGAGAAA